MPLSRKQESRTRYRRSKFKRICSSSFGLSWQDNLHKDDRLKENSRCICEQPAVQQCGGAHHTCSSLCRSTCSKLPRRSEVSVPPVRATSTRRLLHSWAACRTRAVLPAWPTNGSQHIKTIHPVKTGCCISNCVITNMTNM